MNTIKELRRTTKMSQSRFAGYLDIPVANIQHWEQGVTTPPNYLVALISRLMKYDGYIRNALTAMEAADIRNTKAVISAEQLFQDENGKAGIMKFIREEAARAQKQKGSGEKA